MTEEQIRTCSECNKPNVKCKGLCQACYSRSYRKTPTGKASMNHYNATKGKLAQERARPKKPRKPIKVPCECVGLSKSNGFCYKCYQRDYQRKLNALKPKGSPKIPRNNIDEIFKSVLNEVKKGNTIRNACKIANIHSAVFYLKISAAQKTELIAAKIIGPVIED